MNQNQDIAAEYARGLNQCNVSPEESAVHMQAFEYLANIQYGDSNKTENLPVVAAELSVEDFNPLSEDSHALRLMTETHLNSEDALAYLEYEHSLTTMGLDDKVIAEHLKAFEHCADKARMAIRDSNGQATFGTRETLERLYTRLASESDRTRFEAEQLSENLQREVSQTKKELLQQQRYMFAAIAALTAMLAISLFIG